MKSVFIACLLLGSVSCAIFYDDVKVVDEFTEKDLAAIEFVVNLITSETQLELVLMGDSIDGECVSGECVVTNPELEESIREFSQTYERGIDRAAVARTLDVLMLALFRVCDDNEDNVLSQEELLQMTSYSMYNNGIRILSSLSDEYADTPRK